MMFWSCAVLIWAAVCSAKSRHTGTDAHVTLTVINDSFQLQNGFTFLEFNSTLAGITHLAGDFSGSGVYGDNLLTQPFTLEIDGNSPKTLSNVQFQIVHSDDNDENDDKKKEIVVKITGISSSQDNPIASETWTVSLKQNQRFINLVIEGKVLQNAAVTSITHTFYSTAPSIYAFFEKGVFQIMDKTDACLGSDQPLSRTYALGSGGALDLVINSNDDDKTAEAATAETVFYSTSKFFSSAIQHVTRGTYPRKSLKMEEAWSRKCWQNSTNVDITACEKWKINFEIGVNNMDFPTFPIRDASLQSLMPEKDIRSFLTGIYASPPGCLQSYYDLRDGTIAPTIATPDYGYSPNTNFFDPDNFISISAMLFSGDVYLANEVRKILERTAETMCGIGKDQDTSYCGDASTRRRPLRGSVSPHPLKEELNPRDGQLMHHYINLAPTYESIATSEQLGPNVFWTLSALRYASVTGDFDWLIKMEPFLSLSAHFLLSFFDEDASMLLVPGPLWIDVLVRENYTSDSNAIVPYVFREFASAFDLLHQSNHLYKDSHKTFSEELKRIADAIVTGMNTHLWDENDNDHYVTQLNHDMSTTRDFIDYDSNLLAIAFDVAPKERIPNIFTRVDEGPYTHIRATWCSEIAYTGDACDCYIVGGSVCGDSVVTLGRIGWADAIARKKVGDLKTFETLLLEPLQNDLIKDTWLYERYDSDGNQIRTAYYFEYPSLVAMMLTEIRYGIEMNLQSITINPFQSEEVLDYSFSFGTIYVEYTPSSQVTLRFPGAGHVRDFTVHRLKPSTHYDVKYQGREGEGEGGEGVTVTGPCSTLPPLQVVSNEMGIISFSSPVYSECSIVVSLATTDLSWRMGM